MLLKCNLIIILIYMKNFTTYTGFFYVFLSSKSSWNFGTIGLPGSSYSLHGYSGQLGARLTTVEKAIWTCSRHSMLFLIAAQIRVKVAIELAKNSSTERMCSRNAIRVRIVPCIPSELGHLNHIAQPQKELSCLPFLHFERI